MPKGVRAEFKNYFGKKFEFCKKNYLNFFSLSYLKGIRFLNKCFFVFATIFIESKNVFMQVHLKTSILQRNVIDNQKNKNQWKFEPPRDYPLSNFLKKLSYTIFIEGTSCMIVNKNTIVNDN